MQKKSVKSCEFQPRLAYKSSSESAKRDRQSSSERARSVSKKRVSELEKV